MIDYHVHTILCNHATGTMEQYDRSVVAKGFSTICFLDHLTFQKAGRANAMFPREVPMYVNAARRLAKLYREQISVYPKHLGLLESMLDYNYFDVIYHLNLSSSFLRH